MRRPLIRARVTKGDLAWRQSQRAKLLDDRKVASTRENEVDKTLAETRVSSISEKSR
jgi:hypothetical protein